MAPFSFPAQIPWEQGLPAPSVWPEDKGKTLILEWRSRTVSRRAQADPLVPVCASWSTSVECQHVSLSPCSLFQSLFIT